MKDKDYDADFPAGATWKDWVFGLPFLVLGKTIELGMRLTCRIKGHKVTEGYCRRCHDYFPEYEDGPDVIGIGLGRYKGRKKD